MSSEELSRRYEEKIKPQLIAAVNDKNLFHDAVNDYLEWYHDINSELLEEFQDEISNSFALIEAAIDDAKQDAIDNMRKARSEEDLLKAVNEFLVWEKAVDLLGLENETCLSEIGEIVGEVLNEIIKEAFEKCGNLMEPCSAIKKKLEITNRILRYENIKERLGAVEIFTQSYIFGKLLSTYKLNYDMKIKIASSETSKIDSKEVVDQLSEGLFSKVVRKIFHRAIPKKKTDIESEESVIHFKINDLPLVFYPEASEINQGNIYWIGTQTLTESEMSLPNELIEMREGLNRMGELPANAPFHIRGLLNTFQAKPIDATFILKIKCENESTKELILELSYDVPEYVYAHAFTFWHTEFPEIETNLSTEIEQTKKLTEEMTKDFEDFQRDSDTVHAVTLAPWGFGFTSKLGTNVNKFQDVLNGKHAIITFKKLNIVNKNNKLAEGVYEKEYITPINVSLFGGKAKSTGTSKMTGKIMLELIH